MNLRNLKYLLVYITPTVVLISLFSKNNWSYFTLFFIFILIPCVELFTKGSTNNLSTIEEEIAKKDRVYDWLLYGLVPMQYIILLSFLTLISQQQLPLTYKIGATTAFGIACGVLGINAAHELGHRKTQYEQTLIKMLLLTTLYMHFFIEHNRGHHAHVSTPNDPASSRYGENVYAFFIRSIWGSYWSAWRLESKRLKQNKLAFWSLKNEMLLFQILQLLLVCSIALWFGYGTAFLFTLGAFIGILLLETVNYIEHYGLQRKPKGDKYEKTKPIHSWNSNHPVGRLLLLELSRHSDHHYIATRKYQLLRHYDQSPQMPTGYPGMMLLSFLPPLWFTIMHKRLRHYKATQLGQELS